MAPEWAWFLQHIESEDGYVRFPPLFSRFIANLKIENYPELYENELFIAAMMLRAFLEPEDIKELEAKLISFSLEERSRDSGAGCGVILGESQPIGLSNQEDQTCNRQHHMELFAEHSRT